MIFYLYFETRYKLQIFSLFSRALFGYEGQTNILKVVSKGCDGIEELCEDLNSGKIMYAFIKIYDPKTSLDKYVLINWQGEGANTVRKGICANHLRDIEKFFSGAHLTLNARNEEEVDLDLIIGKLKKCGSEYRFKDKVAPIEPAAPVGTTYQRVNPIKEINSQERDKFWKKEEEEERKRVEQEKMKKQAEVVKLELEIARREEQQSKLREEEEAPSYEDVNRSQSKDNKNINTPEKPVRNSLIKTAEFVSSPDDE